MRLFVAGELPAAVREALAGWGAGVAARRLAPEMLHVTLFFLGERDEPPVDAVRALPADPVVLRPARAAWFGRALAIELIDVTGALGRLYETGFPGWEGGGRLLRPHITVARLGRGARPELPAEPVPDGAFALTALGLWRSHPSSRYEVLTRRMLDAPTG